MIQLLSGLAVAILTVIIAPFLKGEFAGGPRKKIDHYAELREKLDGNPEALANVDALLVAETGKLRERTESHQDRKPNKGNLIGLVTTAAVGGGAVYGLVWVSILTQGSPWSVVAAVGAIVLGLIALGIAVFGIGSVYEPETPRPTKTAQA